MRNSFNYFLFALIGRKTKHYIFHFLSCRTMEMKDVAHIYYIYHCGSSGKAGACSVISLVKVCP